MAENQSPDKTKRRVKGPETFRERAIKASVESDKPKRSHTLRQAPRKAVSPLARPLGRALGKVFNRQPFIFISKIVFPTYFRNSFQELRLVQWPNWQESRQLTFAVLGFAIVFGAVIAGVDYGLDKLFKQILLK